MPTIMLISTIYTIGYLVLWLHYSMVKRTNKNVVLYIYKSIFQQKIQLIEQQNISINSCIGISIERLLVLNTGFTSKQSNGYSIPRKSIEKYKRNIIHTLMLHMIIKYYVHYSVLLRVAKKKQMSKDLYYLACLNKYRSIQKDPQK